MCAGEDPSPVAPKGAMKTISVGKICASQFCFLSPRVRCAVIRDVCAVLVAEDTFRSLRSVREVHAVLEELCGLLHTRLQTDTVQHKRRAHTFVVTLAQVTPFFGVPCMTLFDVLCCCVMRCVAFRAAPQRRCIGIARRAARQCHVRVCAFCVYTLLFLLTTCAAAAVG